MRDTDYEDQLADLVRAIVAPAAPRGTLDYQDWVNDE
jgi:hypothetical protein